MKSLARSALAVVLLATTVPALAQEDAREIAVTFDDLDLTKDQGVARLKQRVRAAVQTVCKAGGSTLKQQLGQKVCARRSSASASAAVARAVSRANQAHAQAHLTQTVTVTR